MVAFLRDLSPFLAILVSIIALVVGPVVSGRVSRALSVAQMREKWIYALRESLIELCTEFDMAPEMIGDEGIMGRDITGKDWELMRLIRSQRNRIRLMVNTAELGYAQLIDLVDKVIEHLEQGISSYDDFYADVEKIKHLAQRAILVEWKKVSTNKAAKLAATA